MLAPWLCSVVVMVAAQVERPTVTIQLRAGGSVTGQIVDHDEHAMLLLRGTTPFVFSWRELELPSVLAARSALLDAKHAGKPWTADDHFDLGQFALRFDRNDVADDYFRNAARLDRRFEPRIRQAWDEFRKRRESQRSDPLEFLDDTATEPPSDTPSSAPLDIPPTETRDQLDAAYRTFGAKVRELLGRDIVLVESDHFLIWTDWELKQRPRLSTWAEAMYAALCKQFELGATDAVFPAKCPMFCFRSKARFRKFAKTFDGYDGVDAVGYTRGIERHGHVHVVLVRPGTTPADLDRFACTLVHEGTHAFLHRLYSHQLLPPWVNEGMAELTVESVLPDRCDTGETAALLARGFAANGWELGNFITGSDAVEVQQYPLAHSLIAYLQSRGPKGLPAFIRSLKQGRTVTQALAEAFDGLTPNELDRAWRASNREPIETP